MSLNFLIVDDSRMSRLILQGLAQQRHPDWTVLHASSGEEALARVQEQVPNLVIMDFGLPGISGLESLCCFSGVATEGVIRSKDRFSTCW